MYAALTTMMTEEMEAQGHVPEEHTHEQGGLKVRPELGVPKPGLYSACTLYVLHLSSDAARESTVRVHLQYMRSTVLHYRVQSTDMVWVEYVQSTS